MPQLGYDDRENLLNFSEDGGKTLAASNEEYNYDQLDQLASIRSNCGVKMICPNWDTEIVKSFSNLVTWRQHFGRFLVLSACKCTTNS